MRPVTLLIPLPAILRVEERVVMGSVYDAYPQQRTMFDAAIPAVALRVSTTSFARRTISL